MLAQSSSVSKLTAVDTDRGAISYAKSHYQAHKITFQTGDARTLQFAAQTFDAIVSFETIEHLADSAGFLRQSLRLTKPGGTLICSTPNQNSLPFDRSVFPHHLRHFTPEEFDTLLQDAGWSIEERFSQPDASSADVVSGWGGKYNIAVCRKPLS
jgi:2-polyprenyl-3-methyl-5-hydroxy-6-metoxy-1,4-benzoquinol methylase